MPLRIIFFGTPAFACPALQALHDDPAFEVVAVITQPDKPAGRGKKLTAPPVKILAETLGIPMVQPEDMNRFRVSEPALSSACPELVEGSKGFRFQECDFLVLVAYGEILSKELLAWPKRAPVNVHPSLLPRWRGPSPMQNAILSGDKETGVTIQRMIEKTDAGPILAQERVLIEPRDTKITLETKLSSLGAKLLVNTLKQPLQESPQDETKASYCRKLTREMGNVDPSRMTAEEIDRHVRALVPWPGVWLSFSSSEASSMLFDSSFAKLRTRSKKTELAESRSDGIKLIETSLEENKDAFELSCKENTTLYIVKLQSPGKRVMTGAEWERGYL